MNTNQKEKYYDIVNGPNKDALFDACKYACVKGANIPISFDVAALAVYAIVLFSMFVRDLRRDQTMRFFTVSAS